MISASSSGISSPKPWRKDSIIARTAMYQIGFNKPIPKPITVQLLPAKTPAGPSLASTACESMLPTPNIRGIDMGKELTNPDNCFGKWLFSGLFKFAPIGQQVINTETTRLGRSAIPCSRPVMRPLQASTQNTFTIERFG